MAKPRTNPLPYRLRSAKRSRFEGQRCIRSCWRINFCFHAEPTKFPKAAAAVASAAPRLDTGDGRPPAVFQHIHARFLDRRVLLAICRPRLRAAIGSHSHRPDRASNAAVYPAERCPFVLENTRRDVAAGYASTALLHAAAVMGGFFRRR